MHKLESKDDLIEFKNLLEKQVELIKKLIVPPEAAKPPWGSSTPEFEFKLVVHDSLNCCLGPLFEAFEFAERRLEFFRKEERDRERAETDACARLRALKKAAALGGRVQGGALQIP